MDSEAVIAQTRRWIADIVIGLDLCPFAGRAFAAEKIRYRVSAARTEEELLNDLASEIRYLADTPAIETTLLIHPHVLTDFFEYNDFLNPAEELIEQLEMDGVVQLASFHPDYRFADAEADAVENYTNRSPFPMLHLLREDSISAVADNEDTLLAIPARNVETLRQLGLPEMLKRLQVIREGTRYPDGQA
jgi:uncharacterized protein